MSASMRAGGVVDRHGHGGVGEERDAGDRVAEGGRVALGGDERPIPFFFFLTKVAVNSFVT
jgi:hypothetical protein